MNFCFQSHDFPGLAAPISHFIVCSCSYYCYCRSNSFSIPPSVFLNFFLLSNSYLFVSRFFSFHRHLNSYCFCFCFQRTSVAVLSIYFRFTVHVHPITRLCSHLSLKNEVSGGDFFTSFFYVRFPDYVWVPL